MIHETTIIKTQNIKGRMRTASNPWKKVFQQLATSHPTPFNYQDLQVLTAANNINITKGSLRAKMKHYCQRDYITRITRGTFRIAPEGIKFFSLLSSTEDKQ